MKFSIEAVPDANSIHAYEQDYVLIKSGLKEPVEQQQKFRLQRFENSFIVTSTKLMSWDLTSISAIESHDLDVFSTLEIDVLLLTIGPAMQLLSPKLVSELSGKGIGVECMEIGAACRTYNLLLAENRPVGLAVIFQN